MWAQRPFCEVLSPKIYFVGGGGGGEGSLMPDLVSDQLRVAEQLGTNDRGSLVCWSTATWRRTPRNGFSTEMRRTTTASSSKGKNMVV